MVYKAVTVTVNIAFHIPCIYAESSLACEGLIQAPNCLVNSKKLPAALQRFYLCLCVCFSVSCWNLKWMGRALRQRNNSIGVAKPCAIHFTRPLDSGVPVGKESWREFLGAVLSCCAELQ